MNKYFLGILCSFTLIISNNYCLSCGWSTKYIENAVNYAKAMQAYNQEKAEQKYRSYIITEQVKNPYYSEQVRRAKRDAKVTFSILADIQAIARDKVVKVDYDELNELENRIRKEVNKGNFLIEFENEARKMWSDLHEQEKKIYQERWREFHNCK